jgi:hypothetical protein
MTIQLFLLSDLDWCWLVLRKDSEQPLIAQGFYTDDVDSYTVVSTAVNTLKAVGVDEEIEVIKELDVSTALRKFFAVNKEKYWPDISYIEDATETEVLEKMLSVDCSLLDTAVLAAATEE